MDYSALFATLIAGTIQNLNEELFVFYVTSDQGHFLVGFVL